MQKEWVCIIPARLASKRFPRKPLALINGIAMLVRVCNHAAKSHHVKRVVVAAYDQEIADFCGTNGIEAILVDPKCKNGSEAVADAARLIDDEWIFEMQGDQPLVTPDVIDSFLQRAMKLISTNANIDVVIPYASATDEQIQALEVLKVVKTASDRLIFQTRQPIRTGYRTLGLYVWKRDALMRFANLPVSDIEQAEDSHPIRLYVNDFYVQGLPIQSDNWVEVDREYQIHEVEQIVKEKGMI